jgi:hypothetical protein
MSKNQIYERKLVIAYKMKSESNFLLLSHMAKLISFKVLSVKENTPYDKKISLIIEHLTDDFKKFFLVVDFDEISDLGSHVYSFDLSKASFLKK